MSEALSNTHVERFIDNVFLPAITREAYFDRGNFGASFRGDQERFRNDFGHIYPHTAPVHAPHLGPVVAEMRRIIAHSSDLCCFRCFFFDSWCRGIKNPLLDRLSDSMPDLEWELVDFSNSYVDFAMEARPHSDIPAPFVIGLPTAYTREPSNLLLHLLFYCDRHNRVAPHVYR